MTKSVRRGIEFLIIIVACAGGVGWYAISKRAAANSQNVQPPANGADKGVPVVAVVAAQRDVPIYLDGLGTVQAYQTVTIRTQVDGQIVKIAFKEGQDVHKGDLLAQIDAQPYQAQLELVQAKKLQDEAKILQDQAKVQTDQAKVKQDQAKVNQDEAKKTQDSTNLANARVNLKRLTSTQLENAAAISQQSVDDQQSLVSQLGSAVEADEAAKQADIAGTQADEAVIQADYAAIKSDEAVIQADVASIKYAQTQLAYTTINSPIDGIVGVRYVDEGNVVRTSDVTGIVLVTQLQPISVIATLPQQNLLAINKRMAEAKLPILAMDPNPPGTTELDRGLLDLIDNQIDQTTGTIKLKSTFPNAQRKLWPGGFVNARLLLDTHKGATVLPSAAVQQGPSGTFVYVVKPDNTVDARPVVVELVQDADSILSSGIEPGEQVVLTGQDRLKVGALVAVRMKGAKGSKDTDETKDSKDPNAKPGHAKPNPDQAPSDASESKKNKHGKPSDTPGAEK